MFGIVIVISPILRANGLRYRLVGGTRQRRFDGSNFKPQKVLENAPRSVPPRQPRRTLPGFGCIILMLFRDAVLGGDNCEYTLSV